MNQQMIPVPEYIPNVGNHTDTVIGLGLQRAREQRSLSRSELAFHLSWTYQALEAYEQGFLPISASSLYTLCEALDIRIDDFYDLAFG
jgi:transcriptional regulator with XRE-family HTH domain